MQFHRRKFYVSYAFKRSATHPPSRGDGHAILLQPIDSGTSIFDELQLFQGERAFCIKRYNLSFHQICHYWSSLWCCVFFAIERRLWRQARDANNGTYLFKLSLHFLFYEFDEPSFGWPLLALNVSPSRFITYTGWFKGSSRHSKPK